MGEEEEVVKIYFLETKEPRKIDFSRRRRKLRFLLVGFAPSTLQKIFAMSDPWRIGMYWWNNSIQDSMDKSD